jgi:hypothetical protein
MVKKVPKAMARSGYGGHRPGPYEGSSQLDGNRAGSKLLWGAFWQWRGPTIIIISKLRLVHLFWPF